MGRVDEMNAQALSDRMDHLEEEWSRRFTAMENELAAMRKLVDNQSRVIGEAMQAAMGSGSTVPDPHPEDER